MAYNQYIIVFKSRIFPKGDKYAFDRITSISIEISTNTLEDAITEGKAVLAAMMNDKHDKSTWELVSADKQE